MKKLVGSDIGGYSFNPTAKTITFSNCGNIGLRNILLITNVTSHILIYNFTDTATTGTMVGNVLTLTYNTSSMAVDDVLQIYLDLPDPQQFKQENIVIPVGTEIAPLLQLPDGTLLNRDINLERIFGSERLLNLRNQLNVAIADNPIKQQPDTGALLTYDAVLSLGFAIGKWLNSTGTRITSGDTRLKVEITGETDNPALLNYSGASKIPTHDTRLYQIMEEILIVLNDLRDITLSNGEIEKNWQNA